LLAEFVGCLPLGVRLTASLLRRRPSLSPGAALVELRCQPLGVLEQYRGHASGLVAAFQVSWDALSPTGRRVLQALSVCARWTRAEVVASVAGVQDPTLTLDDLAVQSLVEYSSAAQSPWGLHDVVRIFVQAQPGQEELSKSHVEWVIAHIERHGALTEHMEFACGVGEAIHAVDRLLTTGNAHDAELIYEPLDRFLQRVGRFSESIEISERFLRNCQPDSIEASRHLNNLGVCYRALGDLSRAVGFIKTSLAIEERVGSIENQAARLGNLGVTYGTIGNIPLAITYLARTLAIHEELNDHESQAKGQGNLGVCYQTMGDYSTAICFLERSLSIAEAIGELEIQADALGNLGNCYRMLGKASIALDFYQRSLAISDKIGRRPAHAGGLVNMATCHSDLGNNHQAIRLLKAALDIAEELGQPDIQAAALGNMGVCYQDLGDLFNAIDLHERALALELKQGRLEGQAQQLANLGSCYLRSGDLPRSQEYLHASLALCWQMGLPDTHPSVRAILDAVALQGP
jgi:tetratricopeptide (TPR) repeat protein